MELYKLRKVCSTYYKCKFQDIQDPSLYPCRYIDHSSFWVNNSTDHRFDMSNLIDNTLMRLLSRKEYRPLAEGYYWGKSTAHST